MQSNLPPGNLHQQQHTGFQQEQVYTKESAQLQKALSCMKCNQKYDTCTCEKVAHAPIIHRADEKTVIIKHVEPTEVRKEFSETEVIAHQNAPIIQTHEQAPIIKEYHQDVIHEHHKEIVSEHHKNVLHEHHQPVIHEFHQPVIHEKHVHEIHQPIIHKKEQEIIHEKSKEVVHEKKEGYVHEEVRATVKHEEFAKPIMHSTQVLNPIVENTKLQTQVFTEEKNLHLIEQQKLGHGEAVLDPAHPQKKSFGQKIKGIFSGNPEDKEIQQQAHMQH